ncbi:hypothetical protein M427DRAFT_40982 [Gonapodya prolifera JEL478]|uniref:Histidine kinase n=1 Tax=Gonapodya prolifera (strain JEL478) TaxID=1344416 RepID=A0A139AVG9_GONPJ|nr:hypothetical protein M427DRAFT_40982 [Gonapodya prolifera JEL478]|eukprot:KXS20707.1 hypothetical protein M427DRAFT_40982 [Gonapodya prolifera JEL478]
MRAPTLAAAVIAAALALALPRASDAAPPLAVGAICTDSSQCSGWCVSLDMGDATKACSCSKASTWDWGSSGLDVFCALLMPRVSQSLRSPVSPANAHAQMFAAVETTSSSTNAQTVGNQSLPTNPASRRQQRLRREPRARRRKLKPHRVPGSLSPPSLLHVQRNVVHHYQDANRNVEHYHRDPNPIHDQRHNNRYYVRDCHNDRNYDGNSDDHRNYDGNSDNDRNYDGNSDNDCPIESVFDLDSETMSTSTTQTITVTTATETTQSTTSTETSSETETTSATATETAATSATVVETPTTGQTVTATAMTSATSTGRPRKSTTTTKPKPVTTSKTTQTRTATTIKTVPPKPTTTTKAAAKPTTTTTAAPVKTTTIVQVRSCDTIYSAYLAGVKMTDADYADWNTWSCKTWFPKGIGSPSTPPPPPPPPPSTRSCDSIYAAYTAGTKMTSQDYSDWAAWGCKTWFPNGIGSPSTPPPPPPPPSTRTCDTIHAAYVSGKAMTSQDFTDWASWQCSKYWPGGIGSPTVRSCDTIYAAATNGVKLTAQDDSDWAACCTKFKRRSISNSSIAIPNLPKRSAVSSSPSPMLQRDGHENELGCPRCRSEIARLSERIKILESQLNELQSYPNLSLRLRTHDEIPPEVDENYYRTNLIFRLEEHSGPDGITAKVARRVYHSHPRNMNGVLDENGLFLDLVPGWDDDHKALLEAMTRAYETRKSQRWYTQPCVTSPAVSNLRELVRLLAGRASGKSENSLMGIVDFLGEDKAGPLFLCTRGYLFLASSFLYTEDDMLRAQERRVFQQILDLVPVWIYWCDMDGNILYTVDNEYFRKLSSCTPEDVKGEAFDAGLVDSLWKRKDGKVSYIRSKNVAVTDVESGIAFRYGYTVDRGLEHELLVKNEQLLDALERAEAGSRTKDLLLANVSHELRTPLNGLLGMARLLRETPGLSPDQMEYVDGVEESGIVLQKVIEDLLEFSRMEMGKTSLEAAPFSVRGVCEGVVSTLNAAVLKRPNVTLNVDIADDVPDTLIGDSGRLWQILMNLTGNALKFTEEGTVRLSVCRSAGPADLQKDTEESLQKAIVDAPKQSGVWLLFSVSDTGIGIPEPMIDRLFKPFFQVDPSTNRKYGGTGLGLAIAKQLVEIMGGSITVKSRSSAPNQGSTFSFTIRAAIETQPHANGSNTTDEASSPQHSQPRSRPAPSKGPSFELKRDSPLRLHKPRILIAEDNEINQRVVVKLLSKLALSSEIASDGREAVDSALRAVQEGKPFDVILMDIMMPRMSGIEATHAIRAFPPEYPQPHIIALTANASERDVSSYLKIMEGFVSKPIQFENFVTTLEHVVRLRNAD